jgi:hypothetical protein
MSSNETKTRKSDERIYYEELFQTLDITFFKRNGITYFINPTTNRQNELNLTNLRRSVDQLIHNGIMVEEIKFGEENIFEPTDNKINTDEKIESKNIYENPTLSGLRELLKTKKGSTVRIVIYRNNSIILDQTYNIPTIGFGGHWHRMTTNDLIIDSNTPIIPLSTYPSNELNTTYLEFFVINELQSSNRIIQNFQDGPTHCILVPILRWAIKKKENSKSKKRKKEYQTKITQIKKLISKYNKGVPEDDIQSICNLLQIDIRVDFPLNINETFLHCKSSKKRLKRFAFINTRLNHVDLNEVVYNDKPIYVNRDDLYELKEDLDKKLKYYIYKKDSRGISSITTFNGKYIINNDYFDTVNEFENKSLLNICKVDDIFDEELSKFIKAGTNYNTTVDFKDIYPYTTKYLHKVKHIDMKKAYANFHKCKWYEGFMAKITDFRMTSSIQGIGMYLVTDFKFPDNKLKDYNRLLRIYHNDNIYCSPELKMLSSFGVTYTVKAGCWGVKPLDFNFNEDMLSKKDDDGIRFYAKWTGASDQHNLYKSFYMRGDYNLFQNIRNYVSEGIVKWIGTNEGCISYKKPYNYHLGHISAQITMYQRLNMIEQLMVMDIDNIIRICVDGIYYVGDTPELKNVFREKEDKNFGNDAGFQYVSNVITETGYSPTFKIPEQERDNFRKELHLGAGGTGKTHKVLTDKGLVRKLYVAPSRKLVRKKNEEYSIRTDVLMNLMINDPYKTGQIAREFSVLVLDEVSMMTNTVKQLIFKNFPYHKLIFCGDVGYQLPTHIGEPINMKGFDIIKEHKTNYRIKCNQLQNICNILRFLIKNGTDKGVIDKLFYRKFINKKVIDFFIERNRVIDVEELKELYSVEDYILVGTKAVGYEYTNLFKGAYEKEKYYFSHNSTEYSNGDIKISSVVPSGNPEVRHHFTTHSIQGETIKTKIFIDTKKMFDSRMFYTAISRAVMLDQIFLVC